MNSSSNELPNGQYGKSRMSDDTAARIKQQTAENTIKLLRDQLNDKERQLEKLRKEAKELQQVEAKRRVKELDILIEYVLQQELPLPRAVEDVVAQRAECIINDNVDRNPVTPLPDTVPTGGILFRHEGKLCWRAPDGSVTELAL